jgi:tetratricopeptide (TPR) repeat protein
MHGPSTSDLDAASPLLSWSDHNTRGLALASDGAWEEATYAFSSAAESLASENDVASHEALALVLNNLAHGSFRVGRVDDAITYAQRACTIRVALFGEDAIVVARARTDLAVMLAANGRADEAMSLVIRAIAGIERTAGDESLHLQYALENAARLAMSVGQPSSAEPHLLRLHALLGAHELPTDRADALLAGVSQHRANARVSFGLATVEAPEEQAAPDAESVPDDIELTEDDTTLVTTRPSNDILGIDFDLVELTPAHSPAITAPAPVAGVAAATNVLGFEVRYGTQPEDEAALAELESMRPPTSVRVPTPQPVASVAPPAAIKPPEPQPAVTANKVHASNGASRVPQSSSQRAAEESLRERKIRLPKFRFS